MAVLANQAAEDLGLPSKSVGVGSKFGFAGDRWGLLQG
jgi:hypothetical protein